MSTPKEEMPIAAGQVLAGKYRVERVLGKGGMGMVVAAEHLLLRQKVAIKFLLPDATDEVVQRFQREARSAARLRSEHVARVIDVAELPDGGPYMVMEYLEGSDLSRVLRKRGPLPVEDAVDYLLQACEAIAEAHTAGIVHRDLKPANLFLTTAADGTASVKVLDFGISKDNNESSAEEAMALTRTTAVLGSPYYMAPEQMRSTRSVDARADIWSLGIILYQLLTKSVPFKSDSFVELALMVVNEDPAPPTSKRPDLPPGLEEAILRCIRKKPAERWANVAEMAIAIAPFGRASARSSAERIARMQGVAVPSFDAVAPAPVSVAVPVERPTSPSVAPPPPSTLSGPQSLGTPMSSGPSIRMPSVPPTASGSAVTTDPSVGLARASAPPTGKDGTHTGSAWTGGSGGSTIQARQTGTRVVILGAAAGMVFAGVVAVAALRGHTGKADTPATPATAAVTAEPAPVNVLASDPTPAATVRSHVDVTAGTAAPLPGASAAPAPSESASAGRPGAPRGLGHTETQAKTAAPAAVPPPAAPSLPAAPPAAPPPPVAPPPPAAPPAATAPPTKKHNPLDIDIK